MLALDGHCYDVIFIGTDGGNILKIVNLAGISDVKMQTSYHIYTVETMNVSYFVKKYFFSTGTTPQELTGCE